MSKHRFPEIEQFFDVVERFERHLQREASNDIAETLLTDFVLEKETLSAQYGQSLEALGKSGILTQLHDKEKETLKQKMHHVKEALLKNIRLLQERGQEALKIAAGARESLRRHQQSAFYTRRGTTLQMDATSYVHARI